MTRQTYADLLAAAQPLVMLALAALAAWLAPVVNRYVKSRRLATVLDTVGHAADAAVASVYQKLVKDAKSPLTASAWNAGVAAEAKSLALAAVQATVGDLLAELPKLGVADAGALLSQLIERAVTELNARVASSQVAAAALASVRPPPMPADEQTTPTDPARPTR